MWHCRWILKRVMATIASPKLIPDVSTILIAEIVQHPGCKHLQWVDRLCPDLIRKSNTIPKLSSKTKVHPRFFPLHKKPQWLLLPFGRCFLTCRIHLVWPKLVPSAAQSLQFHADTASWNPDRVPHCDWPHYQRELAVLHHSGEHSQHCASFFFLLLLKAPL